MLYDITDMVTLGSVIRVNSFLPILNTSWPMVILTLQLLAEEPYPAGTYTLDLDFPQQAAVGIAVHATQAFTVAADVKWINWSDTMDNPCCKRFWRRYSSQWTRAGMTRSFMP